MIQPGMMFGGEGPVMQGTWYNPTTGDAFTVRDSFFEDNQYVITTTDGRYLRYDQIQNYIQSDMKLEDLKKMKTNKVADDADVPLEVAKLIEGDDSDLLLPEDMALINTPKLGNIYQSTNNTPTPAPIDMNSAIIDKALKNTSKPDFTINIQWGDYPAKQVEMLKDIMDIPMNEIVDWYLNNVNIDEFITAFKSAIKDKIILKNIGDDVKDEILQLDAVKDDAPGKTTPKTGKPKATRSSDSKQSNNTKK